MQQGRWVSYIYRYRNGVRCENAGFIKVQKLSCKKGPEARIQIGLKLMKEIACKCQVYLLYEDNKVKYLTDIDFKAKERDTIMKRVEIDWDRPLDDVIPFDAYDGLFFVCEDGEILAGLWHEHSLNLESISVTAGIGMSSKGLTNESLSHEKKPDKKVSEKNDVPLIPELISSNKFELDNGRDNLEEDKLNVEKNTDELDVVSNFKRNINSNKKDNIQDDKIDLNENEKSKVFVKYDGEKICKEMLATYPKLPILADSQFIECVKIVPQDIGKLSMGNWKLGVNSFLSHGYYHYRYIMLGKVKFERNEIYVIGVPGVFTNKEKYLANMFGFSIFIPAKKTRFLTGNFGYWISEISRE